MRKARSGRDGFGVFVGDNQTGAVRNRSVHRRVRIGVHVSSMATGGSTESGSRP